MREGCEGVGGCKGEMEERRGGQEEGKETIKGGNEEQVEGVREARFTCGRRGKGREEGRGIGGRRAARRREEEGEQHEGEMA